MNISRILAATFLCLACLSAYGQNPPAPREVPEWVKVEVPDEYKGFLAGFGLPEDNQLHGKILARNVRYIDFWQANNHLIYRPETAGYLYSEDYSSTKTPPYIKGTLPTYERLVEAHCQGMTSDREKALVLLGEVLPKVCLHPTVPPLAPMFWGNRGLNDEELVQSGKGYCNEQARVFVRLCQVAGIPARMIYLFYSDKETGHVIAEFYADGRWSMAETSYFIAFPAEDGHLMSAAECHAEGKPAAGKAYYDRYQEIIRMSDDEIAGEKYAAIADEDQRNCENVMVAQRERQRLGTETPQTLADLLDVFGVMEYPLPPAELPLR